MFVTLVALSCINLAFAVAMPPLEQRASTATQDVGRLYAYGTGIEGLPLFYGDGSGYVGQNIPPDISDAANLTFYHPSDSNMSLVANPTVSRSNWTSPALSINNAPGAFGPVGFIGSEASRNSTTQVDFVISGNTIFYQDSSRNLHSNFYATPTSADGTYSLMWNTDNTVQSSSAVIVVKNLAPPAIP